MTHLDRRQILGAGLAAGLLSASQVRGQTLARSTLITGPFVEVETASGKVRGGHERGALAFKGVPYAGDVSGADRFKAPPPVTPWTGVFDATNLGAPAMQTAHSTYGENEPAYSENCLVLNVWTPAVNDGRKRPVMFYLHGGGYSTGSAGSTTQDGARLAAVYDVVVVACNHRLGLLGFLYLGDLLGEAYATSGNQSMLDMVAALQWVQANIAAFGGDPGNVTIFGESGGGAKVGTLLGMPAARGLFHKAGIQSGAALRRMPKEAATETARRLLKALDISDARQLLDVPAQKLLDLQWAAEAGNGPLMQPTDSYAPPPDHRPGMSFSDSIRPGHFGPVIDGTVLPDDPFNPAASPLCANIPLLIGNNKEEATFLNMGRPETFDMDEAALTQRVQTEFGDRATEIIATYRKDRPQATPSDLYIAIATARAFGFDTVVLAGQKAAQAAPVYLYRWDYRSNRPIAATKHTLGAGHATDIGPTFYNWDQEGLHGNGPGAEPASHHLSALWASFARTGVPSAKNVPVWPRYNTTQRPTMLIDVDCRLIDDPDMNARQMWERMA